MSNSQKVSNQNEEANEKKNTKEDSSVDDEHFIKVSFHRHIYGTGGTQSNSSPSPPVVNPTTVESKLDDKATDSEDQAKEAAKEEEIEQRRVELEAEEAALIKQLAALRDEKHQLFSTLRAILPERD